MTAEKLKHQEDIIKPILEEYPETRGDDFILYATVIEKCRPDLQNLSVIDFLTMHKDLYCPSYESVTRVRRRLQAKYPDLASDKAKAKRAKQEAEYRAYAKEA